MLVVISIRHRLLLLCDSIAKSIIPERCIEDTASFLRYYYPEIQETQRRYDTLQTADSFQNENLNKDCGFHILNFIHAALKNARISQLHETFSKFKARTQKPLNELQHPALTQSTSSSSAIITELTQTQTPQDQSENTPQAQSEDMPQEQDNPQDNPNKYTNEHSVTCQNSSSV